ncbi:MAG: right-handed parallel beta-helix repeat-containing protein [Chitinophagales bacterium]|nr:right-handed parallel beta-helix repeat-containing protein [Chitinophagales bacterium]
MNLAKLLFRNSITAIFTLVSIYGMAQSSSYAVTFSQDAGQVPGPNTDTYSATTGWTDILPGPQSVNLWSATQTLPFTFDFFGQAVTQYKVSANGLLTFDVASALLPNPNRNLPTNVLPSLTIACYWDDFTNAPPLASDDDVKIKVFGTSPNRQLWIKWYSYEYGNPQNSFNYHSIVLEESTNNIYIVSEYDNNATLTTTVGVQFDSTFAVQFGDSTRSNSFGANSTAVADNDYYTFTPLSLASDNSGISAILSPSRATTATLQNVEVQIENFGTDTLRSATIQWSINGVAQTSFPWTGALGTGDLDTVLLGTMTPANGDVLQAWTILPNGNPDAATNNDTTTLQLCFGITGTFTIDKTQPTGGSNFASFQDAVDTLTFCGLAGPVVFNVAAGTGPYTEQVVIPALNGSSSTNTVTFNGNGETLQFAPVTATRYILKLDGADHIILNNLRLASTSATFGYGILLRNNADSNIVRNCTIDMTGVTSTTTANSGGIIISGADNSVTTNGDNANANLFEFNTIRGGGYAVAVNGATGGFAGSVGNRFYGNTLTDFYSYGFYINDLNRIEIDSNDINRATRTAVTTFYGIYHAGGVKNALIEKNRVHDTHTAATTITGNAYGIYFTANDAPVGEENKVINNLLYKFNNTGIVNALFNSGSDGVHYYHNTIFIGDSAAGTNPTRGFYQDLLATNIVFKNNIISVTRSGGTTASKNAIFLNVATTVIESDNNILHVNAPGGITKLVVWGPDSLDLAGWRTLSGNDLASYDVDPLFVNAAGGDFTPQQGLANNTGANVGVADDIFGLARGPLPDIGAIEFTITGLDAGAFAIVNPTSVTTSTPQNVDVTIRNFGTIAVDSVTITYALNGVVQNTIVYNTTIPVGGTSAPVTVGTVTPMTGDVITVWTSAPNSGTDINHANDTAIVTLCVAMAGNFTINDALPTAGTNFTSFGDAVAALNQCGINGPVFFEVVAGSGPYLEQVSLNQIPGASSTNTITFKGHLDTIYAAPGTNPQYIWDLNGADHVILDSLRIVNLSAGNGVGILWRNNADSNIVRNCIIDFSSTLGNTATTTSGILGSNSISSITTTGDLGDFNLFENNTVIGSYYAIRQNGVSTGNLNEGNVYRNNTIEDFYIYGFYFDDATNTTVMGNDISRPTRTGMTTNATYGIYVTGTSSSNVFDGNSLHNTHDSSRTSTGIVYGWYITTADAPVGQENLFVNNIIYNINNAGALYGIYNSGSDGVKYYHNTVSFDEQNVSASALSRGFYQTTAATNIDFRNNIISITRNSSGDIHAIYLATSTSTVTSDNNVLYVNSPAGGAQYIGYYNAVAYDTLPDWQTANGGIYDTSSVSVNPRFMNPLIGDLTPQAARVNNIGDPLGVTLDFLGTTRSLTQPDPGAFEFTPLPDDASAEALLNPVAPFSAGIQPVLVTVRNTGGTDIIGVDVYVTVSDGVTDTTYGPFNYADTLSSAEVSDTINVGDYNFTGGNYTVTIWTANPNGGTDSNPANDTLVINLCTALAGTYTINSTLPTAGTNFQSFNDAASALNNCGIAGAVVFNVSPGTYNEQVTLLEIPGSSASNTVTFDGANADSVILTHNGTIKWATFLLKGTDYVTITNMTVRATASTDTWGIQFMNEADHNTVDNCKVEVSASSTTDCVGILASASETNDATEGNTANYLTISNNTITGGEYGIELQGSTAIALKNIVITGNTLRSAYTYPIYADDVDSIVVTNNNVSNTRATGGDGIYLLDMLWYVEVTGNVVNVNDYGIYILDGNTNASQNGRGRVWNNMVTSSGNYGIYLNNCDSIDVFHNSVYAETGMYANDCGGLDVRNNIFVSTIDYAYEDPDAATTSGYVGLDYNIYYRTDGGNIALFPTARVDLAAWQTAYPAFNDSSIQGDPNFVSTADLHVLGLLANDKGDNSVGLSMDIDGDTRPLVPSVRVDIGADEYEPAANDIAVVDILSPVGGTCGATSDEVIVVLYNNGTASQTNVPVTVNVTGSVTGTVSGTLAGPLQVGERDTLVVGTLNTSVGGPVTVTAISQLGTDQYLVNDTLVISGIIDSIPALPVATGDTVCAGNSAVLTALAGASYKWYDSLTNGTLLGIGDEFFTPILDSTTTFYVESFSSITDSAGIKNAGSSSFISNTPYGLGFTINQEVILKTVHVYPTGTGTISILIMNPAGTDTLFQTRAFNVTGNGSQKIALPVNITLQPGSYRMTKSHTGITNLKRESSGAAFPYATDNNELVITNSYTSLTGVSTTTYYWFYDWVIERAGCSSDRVAVTALVSNPVANAGANQTICQGDSAVLTAQNGLAWLWSTGDTTQSITVRPSITTRYILTITDEFGCNGVSDSVTVTVNAAPTADAGANDTICPGGTATLTASGGVSYLWSNSATTASIQVSPLVPTTYYVTVTGANGCTAVDSTSVLFFLPSNSLLGNDTAICIGESITLTASAGTSFNWNTGDNTQSITVSPTTATSYFVDVTDGNGCAASDTILVGVNALPTVSAGADQQICEGDTATLTATGAVSYLWDNGVSTGSINVSPIATTDFIVVGTDGNGCVAADTVTVAVDALPVVSAGADTAICTGDNVTLTATGAATFLWNGGFITSSITVSPSADTDYIVTGTNNSGCSANDTVTVIVNALPNVSFTIGDTTCLDTTVTLVASPSGGAFSGQGVSGNTFDATGLAEGQYIITYAYTDGNGCASSASDTTLVDDCTVGIDDPTFAQAISVYPNPFGNALTVDVQLLQGAEVSVRLTDLVGKTIIGQIHQLQAGDNRIQLFPGSELASGVYMLELRSGGEVKTYKLLKAQ